MEINLISYRKNTTVACVLGIKSYQGKQVLDGLNCGLGMKLH